MTSQVLTEFSLYVRPYVGGCGQSLPGKSILIMLNVMKSRLSVENRNKRIKGFISSSTSRTAFQPSLQDEQCSFQYYLLHHLWEALWVWGWTVSGIAEVAGWGHVSRGINEMPGKGFSFCILDKNTGADVRHRWVPTKYHLFV